MLAREFMRLCALEALRPSALLAENGPWPTIAGPYVADSRIDPFDQVPLDSPRAIVGVFTERSDLSKIAQSGSQMYRGDADLVFEIAVVANYKNESGDPIVDFADTDAAIEATLGSLEDQIFHSLHYAPCGALWRKMVKLPFDSWISEPHRSGEEAVRLARRTIKARICLKETCYVAAPEAIATGLARLPPVLQGIAEQLGDSSYLADLALGMARVASQMPVRTPFEAVAATITARPAPVAPVLGDFNDLQGDNP